MKPQVIVSNGKAYILTEMKEKPTTIPSISIEKILYSNRESLALIVKHRYEQCCDSLRNGVVIKVHEDSIEYIDNNNMYRIFNLKSQNVMIELYDMLSGTKEIRFNKLMLYQLIKSFPFFEGVLIHEGIKEDLMTYILEEFYKLVYNLESEFA